MNKKLIFSVCFCAKNIRILKIMDKQYIANAFKKARENARLKRKEVADILGNSEKTVSAWENSRGQPDIETLYKLCDIYKISGIDELFNHSIDGFELKPEEKDLINIYRQLTTNSKQIVMTLSELELHHVHAVKQGETQIKILPKTKEQMEIALDAMLAKKTPSQKEQFLRVYNQSAAAGLGDFINDDSFEMVSIPSIPEGAEFGIRISGDSMQPQINNGDIVFVKRQSSIEVGEIGIFIYNGDAYCKQLVYKDGTYYLHSLNSKYKDVPILGDSIYSVGKVLDSYSESK